MKNTLLTFIAVCTFSMPLHAQTTTVKGVVTLPATATDAGCGVAYVQFYLGTNPIGARITTSPFTLKWDSTTVANGTYQLTVKAFDKAGTSVACDSTMPNEASSLPQTLIVANPVPDRTAPTVTLGVPLTGALLDGLPIVEGRVMITASAIDDSGWIKKLEISLDNQVKRTATNQSQTRWHWKTQPFKRRDVKITAKAEDEAGNVGSAEMDVTVR
jgi:hypothetical protein